MPEEVAVEEKPVVEEVKAPEAPKPLLRRVIQPKDEKGNPIGSPHVYVGSTEQELMDRMADAISNGTLKIRQLSRAQTPKVPEGAEVETHIPAAKPKELTADERFQIAEKMKNPETVVEGYRELHQATTGRTPEESAAAEDERGRNAAIAATRAAAISFMESHPEYYSTRGNGQLIGEFLRDRQMSTTSIKNYEIAFKELSADGLLDTVPEEAPEPAVIQPVKAEEAKPVLTESVPRTEAPVKREKTAFPSSISREQASGTGAVKPKKPSAAEIAMMNSSQYKAYLEGSGQWGK